MARLKDLISFLIICCIISSCTHDRLTTLLERPHSEFQLLDTLPFVAQMPSLIDESSGIILHNDTLWTHNDSGGSTYLYGMDLDSPEQLKSFRINGVANKDWEELAQDSNYVYVGDFGNNGGNRADLKILKVSKTSLIHENGNPEILNISYADQLSFNHTKYEHNHDCEAMIATDNQLFLFSKNFVDYKTKLYQVPTQAGDYNLVMLDTFDTKGTITGADLDEANGVLALVGYNFKSSTFFPFVWVFYDYSGNDFFSGKSKRINLPLTAQMEGICYSKPFEFLISNEVESGSKGNIYKLDVTELVK